MSCLRPSLRRATPRIPAVPASVSALDLFARHQPLLDRAIAAIASRQPELAARLDAVARTRDYPALWDWLGITGNEP